MKKPGSKSTRSTVALATAVLAIPIAGATHEVAAQKPTRKAVVQSPDNELVRVMVKNVSLKTPVQAILIGLDSGRIIYRNAKDEHFYLDPATGDIRFITNFIIKRTLTARDGLKQPTVTVKDSAVNINIIGTDANGNTLHRNSQGEVFFLDSKTGDMIFVK